VHGVIIAPFAARMKNAEAQEKIRRLSVLC
jgi:hypothetical protein